MYKRFIFVVRYIEVLKEEMEPRHILNISANRSLRDEEVGRYIVYIYKEDYKRV